MKLTIPTEALNDALNKVKRSIPTRTTLPILSNVLLEAADGALQITATDQERRLTITLEAQVQEPGSLTVACDRFSGSISKTKSEFVNIEGDEKNFLHITAGKNKTKMAGLPAKEFPKGLAEPIEITRITTTGEDLITWLKKLSPFQLTDAAQQRPMLEGIHFQSVEGKLVLHSADGRSMLRLATPVEVEPVDCILHFMSIRAILSSEPNGELTLDIGENAMFLSAKNWRLESKLVEANYVNAEGLFGQFGPSKKGFSANRRDLMEAINYTDAFSGDKARRIVVTAENGAVNISGTLAEIGNSNSEIGGEGNASICINPDYFMKLLKSFPEEKISVGCGEGNIDPVIVRNEDTPCMVMPMREV